MDTKQISRAFRIDIYKILAYGSGKGIGSGSIWFLMALPMLFAIVARLGRNNGLISPMSGGVTGLLVAISGMMGILVFSYEDQTGSGKLNGPLPVSRMNQVIGRYAFTLFAVAIAALLQVICGLVIYMPYKMNAVSGLTATVLVAGIVYASLTLPLGYRFPAAKATGFAFIVLFVIAAIITVTGFALPDSVIDNVKRFVMDAKLGPIPWIAIIGIIVAAVMFFFSCRLSMHIYERKDL